MVGVLGLQNVGNERLCRQAARDQPAWGRRLHHPIGAGSAGIFRSPRHDHTQPGRDLVEALGDVLADDMQRTAAAWACIGLRLDDHFLTRQVRRKMAAVRTPIVDALAPHDLVVLLGNRVFGPERGLHVLQRQGHLLSADAFGLAPELGAAQHGDDVIEPLVLLGEAFHLGGQHRVLLVEARVLRGEFAVLGLHSLSLGPDGQDHGLQRLRVIGEVVER
jgi:hypothetical protein